MAKYLRFLFVVIFVVVIYQGAYAQSLADRIKSLPDIISVEKMEANPFFSEAVIILVKQPLDYLHPQNGSFAQRVILSNLSFEKPVVLITEGYGGDYGTSSGYLNELCPLLNANQLFVEHRFFGKSRPDSIDWKFLTVENAAADAHHIVEIFKSLYGNKWISTGISKGGETTLYHRALYPKDVDISVAYVAPLNFSTEEKRHDYFIRHKAGGLSDRRKVRNCQIEFLSRKKNLLPLFAKYSETKNYNYRLAISEIFDYCVLEFAFSFWQWGHSVSDIPAKSETDQVFFDYLVKICSPDYFDVEAGKATFPFFVQALKQLGYYGYNTKPFKDLIGLHTTRNYIDSLFISSNIHFDYDASMSLLVKNYLRKEARNVLLIYGENDPWSASGASSYGNPKVKKIVQPRGSHRTRIGTLPDSQRKKTLSILDKWILDN